MAPRRVDEHTVFLNVPFDRSYERLFVSLIVTLVSLGRTPRSVLEIPEMGQGRLARLHDLLISCRVSVHDLSRVGMPVRFNMPFELGLAFSLRQMTGRHDFVIFERRQNRLDTTLSDLKGCDPLVHGGRPQTLERLLLTALALPTKRPEAEAVRRLSMGACRILPELREPRSATIVTPDGYARLVEVAIELAVRAGMLRV